MELLVIVAVVVIVVAVGVPAIGNLYGISKRTTAKQNAKLVEQMSKALGALGVAHVIPDSMGGVEATARLLREGITVPDGPMAGERFILAGMRDSDIAEISQFLQIRYEENYLRLMFIDPDNSGAMLSPAWSTDGRALLCGAPEWTALALSAILPKAAAEGRR